MSTIYPIGWEFVNAVPESVDNAQAREALIRSGISIATVDAAIQSIPDATEREIAYTQWEYRATVRRSSELVASLGAAIGLTSEQIDDLFKAAARL
jgi:response regulator RpfG family c-di-GMP phosphodiesterase